MDIKNPLNIDKTVRNDIIKINLLNTIMKVKEVFEAARYGFKPSIRYLCEDKIIRREVFYSWEDADNFAKKLAEKNFIKVKTYGLY